MELDGSAPEPIRSTLDMLHRAFPLMPAHAEYMALLSLLYEHLSDRNLAQAIGLAYGIDEGQAWNDIMRSRTVDLPNAGILAQVENRLRRAGYEEWQRES